MGLFFNRGSKKSYCIFCGKELSGSTCPACGRAAKEQVPLSSLDWQKVPVEVANALGEQKRQLFGNLLRTVKEMIAGGDLFLADIHIDGAYEEQHDRYDDDECETEYSYYIQFSTLGLDPCDKDCQVAVDQYDAAEELLKSGRHGGKLLWGRKKRSNYYYAFVPQSDDIVEMLDSQLLEDFVCYGESEEKRKIAPKGGK